MVSRLSLEAVRSGSSACSAQCSKPATRAAMPGSLPAQSFMNSKRPPGLRSFSTEAEYSRHSACASCDSSIVRRPLTGSILSNLHMHDSYAIEILSGTDGPSPLR